MTDVTQPTLPAEGAFSDAELLFISEEPPTLFPPNQNSNWGLMRSILTGKPQEVNDLLSDLYTQMFYGTAVGAAGYLGRWEDEVGVPKAPTGYSDAQRRVWVGLNKSRGPFTETLVREIVESMLTVGGGGPPMELGTGGAPLSAGGTPLYSEGGSVTSQYRVYYDPRNYSYAVWVVSSSTPDLVALARKLARVTPAGMSFTIDNTKSAIIDYGKTVLNKQPAAFYRLADYTDSSGYANNGTSFGTIAATVRNSVTNPGLEVNATGWSGGGPATVARITTDHAFGIACGRASLTGASGGFLFVDAAYGTPVPQQGYACSVYVKGEGSTIGKTLQLNFNESGGSFADQIMSSTTITLTGAWQRISGTGTPVRADRTSIYAYGNLPAGVNGDTFLFDALQIEIGLVVTPYVASDGFSEDGLLMPGKNDDNAGKVFDGSTGYFTVPDQNYIDLGDVFSIEFWMRPATVGAGSRTIIDKGTNSFFVEQVADVIQFGKSGILGYASAGSLVAGTTYHVVVRKAGSRMSLTIDKVLQAWVPYNTGTIENNTSALYIGRRSSGGQFYNGALDEIAIYDRWITDVEIAENYNAGKAIL